MKSTTLLFALMLTATQMVAKPLKVNPLPPALRSGPTAGSGASPTKRFPSSRQMIAIGHQRSDFARDLIGKVITPFHASIARYLEEAKSAGKVRPEVNSQAIAEILTGSLMAGVLRRSSILSALDRQTWIRETVSALVGGISC